VKTLILGGVRSGKSRLAERLAVASGRQVVYVATAVPGDAEMLRRIEAHRRHRPQDWLVVEEPLALGQVLGELAEPGRCLVVDCLTLWLTNLLSHADPARLGSERIALLEALPALAGDLVLVGNETNMGVIPLGEISRRYCDEAGLLHQALTARCDRVVLVVAGLPQLLKGPSLDVVDTAGAVGPAHPAGAECEHTSTLPDAGACVRPAYRRQAADRPGSAATQSRRSESGGE